MSMSDRRSVGGWLILQGLSEILRQGRQPKNVPAPLTFHGIGQLGMNPYTERESMKQDAFLITLMILGNGLTAPSFGEDRPS
jgi:hypothetical protein